ncbi:hypothetical protein ACMU_10335 [Actibacterium mucosum KCTC 23349]|uniref:Antitoxin n=1 Tax=Actibacterium mucosum KCTC 23349 TaxID=1454373 RepID=A0A037ZKH2_9RHOB|nr:type II toxin-antitoxin system prevent-host-death family antitoxin [Actibacterium mucosum]KAJ56144.1 hypothetical protein ACMU_10335 [Actibacterium mucosum KCTC 23349]
MPVFSIRLTDLRPHLTTCLKRVERGEKLILRRHGKPVAALVNMADYARVWDAEEDALFGPIDPATGRRPGGVMKLSGTGVAEKLRQFWASRDRQE